MKILALRVKNLTSLAGEVAIDFEAPPLAHAGLFAITGPTGAGKSTLLDALCLALYDKLPRLGYGDDVCSVLRHGTADGHAEVDFMGRDGGRYRATWKVRRARGRADGQLQKQTLSLTDLGTGIALAEGKRDILAAIEDKVGLDYHQFRRSVLLAQNDFDAFLRAKPDERAGLLELMTGTTIYGELSKAAYDRAKTEDAALSALDEELKRVNVLADDERLAVEAEGNAAGDHAARLTAEADALAREIEWYRVGVDLQARIAEAETRCGEAALRRTETQPERDRIAHIRHAMTAAPLVTEADRIAAETTRLGDESVLAGQALAECEAALRTAIEGRDAARIADEAAENAFKLAGPLLDQAADLDSRIAEGHQRLTAAQATARNSKTLTEQARINAERLGQEHRDSLAAIARREAWTATHQGRKPLADQMERWREAIAGHAKAALDRKEGADRALRATDRLTELSAQERADQEKAVTLTERLAAAERRVTALNLQLEALDQAALNQCRQGLTELDESLSALAHMGNAALALDRRANTLAERRSAAEKQSAQAKTDLSALETRSRAVKAALPEAKAAQALAEAAEGKQAQLLRRTLVEGEPCPVCGSRDHPLDQMRATLGDLLTAQRKRVAELEAEQEAVVIGHATASAMLASAGHTLAHAADDEARLAEERQALTLRWEEEMETASALAGQWDVALPPLPGTPELLDLDEAQATCAEKRHEAEEKLGLARSAEAERHRLQQDAEILHRQSRDLSRRQAQAAETRIGLEAEERTAGNDSQRAALAMAEADERLSAPLGVVPEWRDLLPTPKMLIARLEELAGEWRQALANLDQERETERRLASRCDSAATGLENARLNADKDQRTVDAEQAALDHLSAARATLFEGRPTADVRTDLNTARKQRKAEFQTAQDRWAAAAAAASAAGNRVRMVTESLADTARSLTESLAARDARLAEIALDLDQVRDAMALGDAWIVTAEARQSALREVEAAARAVLDERRQSLAAHMALGQPQRGQEELASLLPLRTAERDHARERVTHLRQRLAEDDRNRGAAEQTRLLIAAQRTRSDLWRGMTDLIGSADGKKFRLFAQGLTLDRLLGFANAHLGELTPRYVLQRAPGSDLDLQVVDRDMADEVRGVANLSGGERFLVSLSLALGLASMSGHRTLSESLFIDEGFGALDAESLDIAIGALETLHASGRKVGVISHVQAMIDRIGVQIGVHKQGGGRSSLEIKAA